MVHLRTIRLAWLVLAAALAGCGSPSAPATQNNCVATPPAAAAKPVPTKPAVATKPAASQSAPAAVNAPAKTKPPQAAAAPPQSVVKAPPLVAPPHDAARLKAHGLRQIASQHLVLVTDLPASAEIDNLPQVFDLAYPQWCDYFALPQQKERPWRINGYLVVDKAKFAAAGLWPANLPPFLHGYARGLELWLYEQPTVYYRRHLLLHEGTHAFMNTLLGGDGPPWFIEGTAELLATHHLAGDKLQLGWFPDRREDVPQLGRIKIVQDGVGDGKLLGVDEVINYGPTAHLKNEPYGWCWALAAFLDGSERWRTPFRELRGEMGGPISQRFRQRIGRDWPELSDGWQVFASEIEHRYDLPRAAIRFAEGEPLPESGKNVAVAADQGWQSSGVRLKAGSRYRLTATGQCVLAEQPKPWTCEPNGISFRYYRGRPLGQLLAVVRPSMADAAKPSAFLSPLAIGLGETLTPPADGTLYLRINDLPSELADNRGAYQVRIEVEKPAVK